MDTSEQYIKMCEKAVEIQEAWVPVLGDYCTHPEGAWLDTEGWVITKYFDIEEKVKVFSGMAFTHSHSFDYSNYETFEKADCTWLPRQDQLQEMVSVPIGTFNDNFWTILEDLRDWGHNYAEFQQWIPLSMEQLWLAFVMNEKYNKVWNGEDWVK